MKVTQALTSALLTSLTIGLAAMAPASAEVHQHASETSSVASEAEGTWTGKVDHIDGQHGMILVDDRTFYFTTGTVITEGSKPAALSSLRQGSVVRVTPQLPLPYNHPPHLIQIQILTR